MAQKSLVSASPLQITPENGDFLRRLLSSPPHSYSMNDRPETHRWCTCSPVSKLLGLLPYHLSLTPTMGLMLGKKAAQPLEGQRGLAGPDNLQAAFSQAPPASIFLFPGLKFLPRMSLLSQEGKQC